MNGDIWDIYQQIQPGGWSPPPGIEGQAGTFTMSFDKSKNQNQANPQPNLPPNTGGQNMPINNFPNAYSDYTPAQRQSMALAQARQTLSPQQFQTQFPNAVPIGGRKSNYNTYQLPSGGTAQLPVGSPLPSGYHNATPYVPPRTAAQQFDLNQAYAQGYGAPSPTIQQGPGGPYRIAGGVAAPIQKPLFPNIFNNPAGNAVWNAGARGLSAVGNFASNIFSGIGNAATRAFNPTSYTQIGVSPFSPNTQSYASRGPNRYFDY